jgi:hypothetical protein
MSIILHRDTIFDDIGWLFSTVTIAHHAENKLHCNQIVANIIVTDELRIA